jgi:hypothetical protein
MRRTGYLTCKHCGKRSYRTEREAQQALGECRHRAERLRRAGVPGITRQERRTYQCEWTGWYHLTSVREVEWSR